MATAPNAAPSSATESGETPWPDSALNGIDSVRKNAIREGAFESKTASNGKFYFVLKASNGQIIGQSQMYASASSATAGIQSVKSNAPEASLDDDS
jgi:uncharacterized protein YegP (UPF0339 family)